MLFLALWVYLCVSVLSWLMFNHSLKFKSILRDRAAPSFCFPKPTQKERRKKVCFSQRMLQMLGLFKYHQKAQRMIWDSRLKKKIIRFLVYFLLLLFLYFSAKATSYSVFQSKQEKSCFQQNVFRLLRSSCRCSGIKMDSVVHDDNSEPSQTQSNRMP